MKVRELIEELQRCDPEGELLTFTEACGWPVTVDELVAQRACGEVADIRIQTPARVIYLYVHRRATLSEPRTRSLVASEQ